MSPASLEPWRAGQPSPLSAYDSSVTDVVWVTLSIGGAGAVLIGLLVGFLIGRTRGGKVDRRPTGPTVAALLQRLVHSSHNGVVVLNQFGDVVLNNPRATVLGVVHNHRADPRARKAAEVVRETGEAMEIDLSPLAARGRQPEAVLGEVRPLGDEFTVVDAS